MNARRAGSPRTSYWIVIVAAGDEPMAVAARDAADVPYLLGVPSVALCSPTTRAALVRAGWEEKMIVSESAPSVAFEVAA